MSTRSNTNSKRSVRSNSNTRTTRSTRTTRAPARQADVREVFDPSSYENRRYRKQHFLDSVGFSISRADSRKGGRNQIAIWNWSDGERDSQRVTMTLSEARSLKAFLDRELALRAR
jgi:hypothetical protein